MKEKFLNFYMDLAYRTAVLSVSRRLKVGAVIVKDDRVPSFGYNGTPAGWDNNCEFEQFACHHNNPSNEEFPLIASSGDKAGQRYRLVTKPEVLHAEFNAIAKLAGSSESCRDSVMFVTNQPCIECAKLIHRAGISTVYFSEAYRLLDGIEYLKKAGVRTSQLVRERPVEALTNDDPTIQPASST